MKAKAIAILLLGLSLRSHAGDHPPGDTLSNKEAPVSTFFFPGQALLKRSITSDTVNSKWIHFPSAKGVGLDKILIWGNIRFITIYRNMEKSYPDMITSDKNFSFTDYPIVNAGTSNNGGVPMLELTMEAPVATNLAFAVGYSYAHTFTGETASGSPSIGSSRSNLRFGGTYATDKVSFGIDAGQVLWARISKFTMGQPIYRDNYFDRVPWDWHRRSFDRYHEYYDFTGNIGPEGFGRSPIQGFVANADIKDAKLSITGVYGRTNRNLIQANATNHFPSLTYVLRVQRGIVSKAFTGKLGLNLYERDANTDRVNNIKDEIQFASLDLEGKRKGVRMIGEVGLGRINNPMSDGKTGLAVDLRVDLLENILPVPVTVEYYDIHMNAVTLDGSIINTNTAVKDGGYANEIIWDNMLYINIAQEADQIANNRRGLIFKTKKNIGNFKAELGWAISQEKENIYDTITFQHRVNAFSRSRFTPWFQASGPYSRIKSGWMRTFETVTITDAAQGVPVDYKKGFNTIELLLKYKFFLFGRDLILLNFSNATSIQDGLSPAPKFGDKAFIRTYYNEFTIAYALTRSFMVVGSVSAEKVNGNNRTHLSPETNLPLHQTGTGYAIGMDYDFHKNAGLHLRHRWMSHKDKNFVNDRFKGQETTFELKIFF